MLPRPLFIHLCLSPRANPPKAVHQVPRQPSPIPGVTGGRGRQQQAGAGRGHAAAAESGCVGHGGIHSPSPTEELWHSPSARIGARWILPRNRRPWQTGSKAEKLPVPACLLKNTTPGMLQLRLRPAWPAGQPSTARPACRGTGYPYQRSTRIAPATSSVKVGFAWLCEMQAPKLKMGNATVKTALNFPYLPHSNTLWLQQCVGRNGKSNNTWECFTSVSNF